MPARRAILKIVYGASTEPKSATTSGPAQHLDAGGSGHRGGGAGLRLAAPFGAGERGAHGADRAHEPRRGEPADEGLVVELVRLGQSEEHAREDTGAAGGRRSDDDTHRGIDLLHREGVGEDLGEEGASEGSLCLRQLEGITTDEA